MHAIHISADQFYRNIDLVDLYVRTKGVNVLFGSVDVATAEKYVQLLSEDVDELLYLKLLMT